MSVGLAPRPSNEEQRVKAVVKTGLIDNPNPELFHVSYTHLRLPTLCSV